MSVSDSRSTHPDDVGAWRREHVPVYNENRIKLGIFGTNCSNGCTITHAETTFVPTYEHNALWRRPANDLSIFRIFQMRIRPHAPLPDSFAPATWGDGSPREISNFSEEKMIR